MTELTSTESDPSYSYSYGEDVREQDPYDPTIQFVPPQVRCNTFQYLICLTSINYRVSLVAD